MFDNVGKPCYPIPGDPACVLLGSERVDESFFRSTSLLQAKCWALICLMMWGSVVNPYLVIREVCCLAVYDDSFLRSTSLLQWKCGALICLIMRGSQVTPCPGIRCVRCLAVNESMSQSSIQPHSFKGIVGL